MEADPAATEPDGRSRAVPAAFTALLILLVLALIQLVASPASAAARTRTYTAPASIAHDCSVDVTAKLTNWIAKVHNRSVLQFAPHGCYRIDGTLIIRERSGLTFDGNGATFRAGSDGNQGRRHFLFVGGTNLVVRDLTVRGANPNAGASKAAYVPDRAFQHAFSFNGVVNARLDHVQAYDVYGDFVYIGSGGQHARWSENIKITNSHFERSGRQGISITAGRNIVIKGNEIGGVTRSMFDLEPNSVTGGAIDVRIDKNVTGAAVNFWLANKGGGTKIQDIVFRRNRMTEGTGGLVFIYGPLGGYRGPFVFEDNRLIVTNRVHDEGSIGAFFLSQASGVTIRDNEATFPAGQAMPTIEIQGSQNVQADGNTFTDAGPTIIETTRPPRGS